MSINARQYNDTLTIALRFIFTIFTIATIIFIFANSSEIGAVSCGKSALITAWVRV